MRYVHVVVVLASAWLAGCEAKVASIEVAPTKLSFNAAGESKTLVVTLKDEEGNPIEEARPVAWTSADAQVARVDDKGNVKAVGTGTTTITATVEGQSAQAAVEVVILKQIQLQSIALVLVAGTSSEPITMTFMNERGEPLTPDFEKRPAWKPVWRSGNTSVATVNEAGVVSAVAAGTTVITASVGDLKSELTLTVNPPPEPEPEPEPKPKPKKGAKTKK
jgi:uncharacterized protein YjdB